MYPSYSKSLFLMAKNKERVFLDLKEKEAQSSGIFVRNGNNTNIDNFKARYNPNLYCIDVDDATWSIANWEARDSQSYFSNNCGSK